MKTIKTKVGRVVRRKSISGSLILILILSIWYGRSHRTEGGSEEPGRGTVNRVDQNTRNRQTFSTARTINSIQAPTKEEYEQSFLNQLVQSYRHTIAISQVAAQKSHEEAIINLAKVVIAEENLRIAHIEDILMTPFDQPLPPELDLRKDKEFIAMTRVPPRDLNRVYLDVLANQHQYDIGLAKNVPSWTNNEDILAVSQDAMAEETKELVQINDMQQNFGFPITTVAGEATGRFDPPLTPTGRMDVSPERSTAGGTLNDDASGIVPGTVNGGVVNQGRYATEQTGASITSVVTPTYQSESEVDRILVQRIHGALSSDKNLTLDAQNVNVTSDHGLVTLRGLVNNRDEHDRIFTIVRNTVGVGQIQDQLEILQQ